MRRSVSIPPEYFEQIFAGDGDPWCFETSAYEASKYDVTLAATAGRVYDCGLEVGCANGVLTSRLASLCKFLMAIDLSDSALSLARSRCSDLANVEFSKLVFPTQHLSGSFDLILMSEVVYYWSVADISAASSYVRSHLRPGGDLLMVHWTGETDYPQTGDEAVRLMQVGLPEFKIICADRYERYRLDLWRSRE